MPNVTFIFDGAVNPVFSPISMTGGDKYVDYLPPAPVHSKPEKYTFDGWYTTDGYLITGADYVPVDDHTLIARYNDRYPHTVRFDMNGGIPILYSSQTCYYGSHYAYSGVLPAPEHSDVRFAFNGWWTTPEVGGVQIYDVTKCLEKADHTLYARWKKVKVNVTFVPNGAAHIYLDEFETEPTGDKIVADVGDPMPLPLVVLHEQDDLYVFDHWETANGRWVTSADFVPEDDITLVAMFRARGLCQVRLDVNGGTELAAPYLEDKDPRRSYGTLPVPTHPDAAYAFDGWWTAPDGGVEVQESWILVQGVNHTLYARWRKAAVKLTLVLNGAGEVYLDEGGTLPLTENPIDATVGAKLPLPAKVLHSQEEYVFDHWEKPDGTWVTSEDFAPEEDLTVIAKFREIFSVTVRLDVNGGEDLETPLVTVGSTKLYGTLPTPTHENDAYVFDGWWTTAETGGVRIQPAWKLLERADHTLFARWRVEVPEPASYWERVEGDDSWVLFDKLVFAENLPSGLADAYVAWEQTPENKAERVDFIVSGVLLDFRSAIEADKHPTVKDLPNAIPVPCLRHAQMMCWYFLGLECGYKKTDSLKGGWQDAEVYLRTLATATRMGANRFGPSDEGTGIPMYSAVDSRPPGSGVSSSPRSTSTSRYPNYFAPG